MADHCQVDLAQGVRAKLAQNALKYPAKHVIARVSPARASMPGTHVLLDYENVQPSEEELRPLVPDARQVRVFHGPHQHEVEQRIESFGHDVTAVPISKTGKNALDFHLSFYMGYIASKNSASAMVVVANDKGYEPMLEHARAMGFAVRRLEHGKAKTAIKKTAAKKAPAKKVAVKKATTKPAATKQPAAKKVAAKKAAAAPTVKKAPARKAAPAKKVAVKAPAPPVTAPAPVAEVAGTKAGGLAPDSSATINKLTESLRKMGDKRPTKPKSLWRSLKSFLGTDATEEAVEIVLAKLIADGAVKVDSQKGASYPKFDPKSGSAVTQV